MKRTEEVELTVLCLIQKDNKYLLQNRIKSDIPNVDAVEDLQEMIDMMLDENLTEFQYVIEEDEWKVILK